MGASSNYFNRHHGSKPSFISSRYGKLLISLVIFIATESAVRVIDYVWLNALPKEAQMQLQSSPMYKLRQEHIFVTYAFAKQIYKYVVKTDSTKQPIEQQPTPY